MTRLSFTLAILLISVLSPAAAPAAPPGGEPLPVDARGEAELSLGLRAESSESRRELAGFLALSVPLERLAAPRRVASVEAPPPAAGTPPAAPPEAAPAETSPAVATEAPRATSRPLAPEVLSALARGALQAARRADRAPERERALDSLASRAKLSSLLPEVRFRAARTRDESLRLTPTTDDPYRFTLAGGDALVLEGAATFHLSRLLFADEELAVERLRVERERNGERRMARVLELVLAWHEALARLTLGEEAPERARYELALDAAAVELDVLTNGWFGSRVRKLGVLPATPAAAPTSALPAERREVPPSPSLDAPRLSATSGTSHACRFTKRAHGPSKARRRAKGVSLTSRASGG